MKDALAIWDTRQRRGKLEDETYDLVKGTETRALQPRFESSIQSRRTTPVTRWRSFEEIGTRFDYCMVVPASRSLPLMDTVADCKVEKSQDSTR